MQFPFVKTLDRKQSSLFAFAKCAALLTAASLALLGCRGSAGKNQAAKLPANVTQSIIEGLWTGQSVAISNISYESPVRSQGGRVPRGIKLYPAKVRVSVGGGPEKEVLLYFYQNAFGAWDAYRVSHAQAQ